MRFIKVILCGLLCLSVLPAAFCLAQDVEYIDISNPFIRKIPLAVPDFKSMSAVPQEIQFSKDASQLLSETLDFTGYFKIIDKAAFLENLQTSEIAIPGINFQNWTSLGAELLVTGGASIQGNNLELELRLIDTFKQKMLIGKRYKGGVEDKRQIIHRFCSEIIYYLTGNWGVFTSKIAFVSNGTGNKEIYVCDFDGQNTRQITHNHAITLFPAWSHDGQWIAYTSYKRGKPDLYIRNLKDDRNSVVAKEGINTTPAWVPGQFALAATLSFAGDPDIYLLTGAGKIITRVTEDWGIDSSPSWSPDASRMAFVSNRSGSPQIYIKNMESNKVRRLTYRGSYNTQPAWSPRGDKIAYSAMDGGRNNICVIGADGEGLVQLTRGSGDNESPSWSPDGNLIVFSTTREGPSRIYVMTAYGSDQRRLLTLQGEQTNPAWSPSAGVN